MHMSAYTYQSYKIYIVVLILSAMIALPVSGVNAKQGRYGIQELMVPSKIGNDDFMRYDITAKLHNNEFKLYEIDDIIVCFYQRSMDGAIIEKDYLNYQFDSNTGALLKKKIHWRTDLPYVHVPAIALSQNDAHAAALALVQPAGNAEVLWSKLFIISPESNVLAVQRSLTDPCWVVRLMVDGRQTIVIIDAITKEFLGYGVVPPDHGFSMTGPQYNSPCSGAWSAWSLNAAYWFEQMGYPTKVIEWPDKRDEQTQVEDPDSVLFYELAHGGSSYYVNGCPDGNIYEFTYASDIEKWIANAPAKSFAFIGSCEGLCYTDDGSFSYEFRKGSHLDTFTVGYCGMSTSHCDYCWYYSIDWQSALFYYMKRTYTAKKAFDEAQADYPTCAEDPACMRFAGDEGFVLPIKLDWYPPNISRILYTQSLEDPFEVLLDGVSPSAYHSDALTDPNNYFYLFEQVGSTI
jgi:hypothetical protein